MAKNKTTAVAVKEEISEADIALCLNQRYDDATRTITERTVVFGATLMQAEAELQKRGLLGGFDKKGGGLKGWLAEHCPNINYSTAIRWKNLAFQMAQGLMSKDRKAVLKIDDIIKLIEGRDDEIEAEVPKAITAQRDALMAAPTVRKFVQQMFDFEGRGNGAGGRPKAEKAKCRFCDPSGTCCCKKSKHFDEGCPEKRCDMFARESYAKTAEDRIAEAEEQTRELMGKIGAYFRGKWFETVSEQTKNDFIRSLKDWAEVASERM